jgi:predicted dienelactone hydrolase
LLYFHGVKVWLELGVFLHEHFASHGWLVAAVEHDHDDLQSAVAPRPDSMYLLRPRDLSEALTQLIGLKVSGEDPVAALLVERYVYAAGHSFGGYTTFALAGARFDLAGLEAGCAERSETFCDELERLRPLFEEGARDERVGLAAPQSSGNRSIFGAEGLSQVAVPTLYISAARDLDCTEEAQNRPYWEGLISSDSSAHRWLSFKNGGHASLTVSCQQFPTLELDNGCGEDFTPPEQLQRLSAEYSLSFARAHFGGDAEAQWRFSEALDDELMSLSLP